MTRCWGKDMLARIELPRPLSIALAVPLALLATLYSAFFNLLHLTPPAAFDCSGSDDDEPRTRPRPVKATSVASRSTWLPLAVKRRSSRTAVPLIHQNELGVLTEDDEEGEEDVDFDDSSIETPSLIVDEGMSEDSHGLPVTPSASSPSSNGLQSFPFPVDLQQHISGSTSKSSPRSSFEIRTTAPGVKKPHLTVKTCFTRGTTKSADTRRSRSPSPSLSSTGPDTPLRPEFERSSSAPVDATRSRSSSPVHERAHHGFFDLFRLHGNGKKRSNNKSKSPKPKARTRPDDVMVVRRHSDPRVVLRLSQDAPRPVA